MQVSIHLDQDGSVGLQVDGSEYQPDVFNDLLGRCKRVALELWESTRPAEPELDVDVEAERPEDMPDDPETA